MPTPPPLMLYDVLDVRPLPALVIAQPPRRLNAGLPLAAVLAPHRQGWVEAALLDKSNGIRLM